MTCSDPDEHDSIAGAVVIAEAANDLKMIRKMIQSALTKK